MKYFICLLSLLTFQSCSDGKNRKNDAPDLEEKTSEVVGAQETLACTANYQKKGPGTDVESVDLVVANQASDATEYSANLKGFEFKVTWNKSLTTLYMFINQGKENIVFSTARIPDENHNDSMMDYSPKGAPRLYLSCDFIEYRPED